ncbi:MAG: glycosyltransferase family 2 protein [Bacteroidales bacterium]|jgi:glycosyltransferase involved in cell wall biosynthesis|nr:glycosyltransferase family 2 protein [Bacteroidales bacterium]
MKLSAVIITYNEARNIERCLTSLRDLADEIVVVDSFSTDSTEDICRKFGVKFIQHAFAGHIEQKNFAMQQATFPFVLSLDADEALSDTLRHSIENLKQQNSHEVCYAYDFNRLTNYCGRWIRHCGWYPDTKLRLWHKEKGCWGGTNPHDKVLMQPNIKIKHLKGDLLHYSYYSTAEHLQQIDLFTTIGAAKEREKGKKVSFCDMILRSKWKFVRDYIFKFGFLDGKAGYQVCKMSSWATYIKYAKLRELNK